MTQPRVYLDLPGLDPQQVDQTGRLWVLLDEAADPTVIVRGAFLVAGQPDRPMLVRVVDVAGTVSDRRVHLNVVGVLIPCDLNFESEEAGVVLAPVPVAGPPAPGAIVIAGSSRAAWSPARVAAIEGQWLHLRLLAGRPGSSAHERRAADGPDGAAPAAAHQLRMAAMDQLIADVEQQGGPITAEEIASAAQRLRSRPRAQD